MAFKSSKGGKSGVVIGRVRGGNGVVGSFKAPGLGSVRVIDQGAFTKASRAAGSAIKSAAGRDGRMLASDARPKKP